MGYFFNIRELTILIPQTFKCMKKLFFLLIISSLSFAACNNATESTTESAPEGDTSAVIADPALGNPPINPADTMVNLDTTAVPADSSAVQL